MKAAFGIKAHSGWAALVLVGVPGGETRILDRHRVEMIEPDEPWAKAPYHAAERREHGDARVLVERAVRSARRLAISELRAAMKRARAVGHEVAACAVLTTGEMPDWSLEEILAVHFRMHKAEGALFRDALAQAAATCGLKLVAIRENQLAEEAQRVLKRPAGALTEAIAALGREIGPPWGRDQKDACLAAMIALRSRTRAAEKG